MVKCPRNALKYNTHIEFILTPKEILLLYDCFIDKSRLLDLAKFILLDAEKKKEKKNERRDNYGK